AIHLPDKEGDQRNHHVHILMTTREVSPDGLGAKAALELSNADQAKRGLPVGKAAMKELRECMADVFNRECERLGIDLSADPRSYADQGVDLTPTKHIGVSGVAMDRKGQDAERVALHAEIRAGNAPKIEERPVVILEQMTQTQAVFDRRDIA